MRYMSYEPHEKETVLVKTTNRMSYPSRLLVAFPMIWTSPSMQQAALSKCVRLSIVAVGEHASDTTTSSSS